MRSTVALVTCDTYEPGNVTAAVRRGCDLIGGIAAVIKPGETIVLKPNVLWASDPDRCVVTHPAVFEAAARLLQEHGARVRYGDSPAGISPSASVLKRSGFTAVAERLGLEQADFDHGGPVSCAEGRSSKRIMIANGVLAADGLVSLSKLKTHGLTNLTLAIKNQYGCVPGIVKGEYHARFPDCYDFCGLLADITACVKPRLYIMDAIWAMEGNGPQSGDPKKMGLLLMSTDPVALEVAVCRIVNMPVDFVPTIEAGFRAGLGNKEAAAIDLVGDPVESFIDPTFKVRRSKPVRMPRTRFLIGVRNHLTPRPAIDEALCTRCGKCIQGCPVDPKALGWRNGDKADHRRSPRYDYGKCIRCFCCHEFCPSKAISIKTPLLRRLLPVLSYIGLLVARRGYRRKERTVR